MCLPGGSAGENVAQAKRDNRQRLDSRVAEGNAMESRTVGESKIKVKLAPVTDEAPKTDADKKAEDVAEVSEQLIDRSNRRFDPQTLEFRFKLAERLRKDEDTMAFRSELGLPDRLQLTPDAYADLMYALAEQAGVEVGRLINRETGEVVYGVPEGDFWLYTTIGNLIKNNAYNYAAGSSDPIYQDTISEFNYDFIPSNINY